MGRGYALGAVGSIALLALTGCLFDVGAERVALFAAQQPTPALHCPAIGGRHWVREGDRLEIELECRIDAERAAVIPSLDSLPTGAYYDEAARRLIFEPGLDQAGLHEVSLTISGGTDRQRLSIGVVDRHDHPDNVPVDPLTYSFEYGLPVIHVFADPGINPDAHTPARVVYMGREYPGAMVKYRGSTSLAYAKKSLTLKFDKEDRLYDPQRARLERRLVLTTTFDDDTQLRQRLAYELWNRMESARIRIATFHAVLFLDGRYHGLYLATDHVDGELMEENGLWEDGNLYKARTHDANFRLTTRRGVRKSALHAGYTKEEGELPAAEPGAYADLEELVRFVATAPSDVFNAELHARLDVNAFADWFVLTSALRADDSAGKNSYLYHDPRPFAPDRRWHYAPWDFNASFGQDWRSRPVAADNDPEALRSFNGLFDRMLTEPDQRDLLLRRYRAALDGPFELASVLSLLDTWATQHELAAERDLERWREEIAAHRGERPEAITYRGAMDVLRQWIEARWRYIAEYAGASQ